LVGANFSVPKRLLELAGGFWGGLGRVKSHLLSNEEVLLERKLQNLGFYSFYDPAIEVTHRINAKRLNQEWFYRRVFWQGVSVAVMERHLGDETLAFTLRKGLRTMAGLARPALVKRLVRRQGDDSFFKERCYALGRLGYGLGILHLAG
jgi:hypothetical protein